jgi:hypothetical protein
MDGHGRNPGGLSRRDFVKAAAWGLAGAGLALLEPPVAAQLKGDRPEQAGGVKVLNPQNRVPVSLIIDDSTCLVNLAHFCIPQFHEVFPDRYPQEWKQFPREIPDAFVREFGEWCRERGVKGKYSVIPYPACVGWLDRDLPGWPKQELQDSLKLVRDFMTQDWDIHPEMVSHTWVIDTKTGRPYPERTARFMENWGWTDGKSADQIADYLSYALRILKNVGLPCEGVTSPGGFGSRAEPEYAQATLQACRDVFKAEIPHYFLHIFSEKQSVAPRVEYASGLGGPDPRCVVSIIGCTKDWFGGWTGRAAGSVDCLITEDLKGGRLPEVIDSGEPALICCHWPGLYFNGERVGFNIFKETVSRLHRRYDNLVWMKVSEIARYWAARELTRIQKQGDRVTLEAPFRAPRFTIDVATASAGAAVILTNGVPQPLKQVKTPLELAGGTWHRRDGGATLCFDLPRGKSVVQFK